MGYYPPLVIRNDRAVLNQPLFLLFGRGFTLRSSWVKHPSRDGLNLTAVICH